MLRSRQKSSEGKDAFWIAEIEIDFNFLEESSIVTRGSGPFAGFCDLPSMQACTASSSTFLLFEEIEPPILEY